MRLAILIGVGLLGTLPCHRAEAAIVYPWCAHYMAPNTAHNCGFATWEQCLTTVRGIGGTCEANPYYSPLTPPQTRRRPTRQG